MPVVSISLNNTLLEKLEEIEDELGFSGRSEVIRTAIRSYIEERNALKDINGKISAVITIKHDHEAVLDTHEYQELIRSQIHDHNAEGNCVQVFIVEGNADKVVEMKEFLESKKEVTKVNLART